jgi:hypothetical protein
VLDIFGNIYFWKYIFLEIYISPDYWVFPSETLFRDEAFFFWAGNSADKYQG